MKQGNNPPPKPSPLLLKKPDGNQPLLKEAPSIDPRKTSRLEKSQEENTIEKSVEDVTMESEDRVRKKTKQGKTKRKKKKTGDSPYCRNPMKKGANKAKMKQEPTVKMGDLFASGRCTWKVEGLLGAGGFGSVYKVKLVPKDPNNPQKPPDNDDSGLAPVDPNAIYAMKLEETKKDKKTGKKATKGGGTLDKDDKDAERLNAEAMIYCQIQKASTETRHFGRMFDKGHTATGKFFVMSLLGESLEDKRKTLATKEFTEITTILIAMQALEALKEFHDLGLVHRDLKPANFTLSVNPSESLLYLIDFGISKKMSEKTPQTPGISAQFVGTIKYAALAAHAGADMTEQDDLESLVYFIYDCWNSKFGLPWSKKSMGKVKQDKISEIRKDKEDFISGDLDRWRKRTQGLNIPEAMNRLDAFVANLTRFPELAVDMHKTMSELLDAVAKALKMDKDAKFEWMEDNKQKMEKSKIEPVKLKNQLKTREDTKEEKTREGGKKKEADLNDKRTDRTKETVTDSNDERTLMEKVKEENVLVKK